LAFTLISVENPELICHGITSIFRTRTGDGLQVNIEKNPCESKAGDGPAHWYGFDMNPATVAKARLVCDFPVEQILQIWFSSCISLEANRSLTF